MVTEETSLDARRREEGSGGSSGSDTLPPGAAVEANGSGAGSSSSSPDKEKEGTAPANKSAGRVLVSDGQRAHRQRTGGARGKEEGGGTARGETIKGRGRCAEGGVDGEEEGVEARRCARQQHEAVRVVVHEVGDETGLRMRIAMNGRECTLFACSALQVGDETSALWDTCGAHLVLWHSWRLQMIVPAVLYTCTISHYKCTGMGSLVKGPHCTTMVLIDVVYHARKHTPSFRASVKKHERVFGDLSAGVSTEFRLEEPQEHTGGEVTRE